MDGSFLLRASYTCQIHPWLEGGMLGFQVSGSQTMQVTNMIICSLGRGGRKKRCDSVPCPLSSAPKPQNTHCCCKLPGRGKARTRRSEEEATRADVQWADVKGLPETTSFFGHDCFSLPFAPSQPSPGLERCSWGGEEALSMLFPWCKIIPLLA